jgi:hypothetical protein
MTSEQQSASAAATFEFEVVRQMSEADYLKWHEVPAKLSGWAFALRCLVTVVAVLCLLNWRTVPLAIMLAIVAAFVWSEPRWSRWVNRKGYQFAEYLHGPLTYGVSSRGMWFRGGALSAESDWTGLGAWGEHNTSVWLSPRGMPQLIFPSEALREAGVYEKVRELASAHSVEYFSALARVGRPKQRAPAT